MISFRLEYTSTQQDTAVVYMDTVSTPQITRTGEWTDTESNPFLIGKNNIDFQGFIYDLFIYSGVVAIADYSQVLTINTEGSCEGFPFYESECLSTCEDPYKDKDCVSCEGECNPCDSSCGAYCSFANPSECIDIRNTFCKPHPFQSNACNFAVTCLDHCYHCDNDTECIECDSGFYLQVDLTCGNSCAVGSYLEVSINQCKECNVNCEECSGPSSSECLQCAADYSILTSGSCGCQDGYFPSVLEPLFCQACNPTCATCDGALESNCLTCSDSNAYASAGNCHCPDRYFTDGSNPLVCDACHEECLTCDGSLSSNCLSCSEVNCSLQEGKCVCDTHTFPYSYGPLECTQCHSNCHSCSGSSASECLSCMDSNAKVVSGECVCQSGFLATSTDPLTCEACPSTCLTCNSLENCTSCKPNNSYLSYGSCLCQDGFFLLSSSQCEECHQTCSTCSGPTESDCLTCSMSNQEIQNGVCTCKDGYYTLEGECIKCIDYCAECTETGCLACIGFFELRNNVCECPEFFEVCDGQCYELFAIAVIFVDQTELKMTSEEPIEEFNSSKLSISIFEETQLNLGYSISQASDKNFTILVSYPEDRTFTNLTLALNFTYPLFSINGKLLKNRQERLDYGIISSEEEDSESLTQEGVAGISSLAVAVTAALLSKITMEDPSVLWTIADVSQYISYLPLVDVEISQECKQFLMSYQSFYFFPNPFVLVIPKTSAQAPSYFEKYGKLHGEFEDIQLVRNGGRFFCIILINVLFHAIIFCSLFCFSGKVREMIKKILNNFWSCCIRIFLTLYLDLAIYGSVELVDLDSSQYIVSMLLTCLVAGLLILLPLFILGSLILSPLDSKYGKFLKNTMKDLDWNSKFSMSFYAILCIRKVIYTLSIYFLRDFPDIIMGVQLGTSICILCAIFKVNFFHKKMGNIIHGIGECVLILTLIGYYGIRHAISIGLSANSIEYVLMGINILFILAATLLSIASMVITFLRKRNAVKVVAISPIPSSDDIGKVFARRNLRMRDLSSMDNSNSIQFDEIFSHQVNHY